EAQKLTLPPTALICLVFDRDEFDSFDRIIVKAEKEGFEVGWSNPCFEIWMHAYFGKMPTAASSKECVGNFADEFKRKTGLEYKKNEPDIFNILERYGSFEKARKLARRKEREAERAYSKPSDRSPSTTVYKLVEKIRGV
ncbi:MAG: RloB domain-containing protein, partial [Thermoguttaceae bacterium]|nr:RloB domain-containing protein [Thermoguttaceae bacterium]